MAGCIKMPLGMEVGLKPEDVVLDGDPVHLPQKGGGAPHQFLAHVYCSRMARWVKMALGMDVGLGPDDTVRWGPSSPSPKGGRVAGYIKMPLGVEVGLSPDDFVLDWDLVHPPQKVGGTPQFLLVAFATSLLLHFKVLLTDGERCDVRLRISVESSVLNGIWSCNEIVKEFKVHCCFSDEEQKCGV